VGAQLAVSLLVVFLLLVFLYSLVSARLERTVVTAPILFSAAGMITLVLLPQAADRTGGQDLFLEVAEIGLVLLLFTDASRTDRAVLRSIRNLPVRLLSTGMLLTIALGAVGAKLVFPSLSLAEAGILAAILAPTDAGLGQIIVTSERVPAAIRQALNVEAGLNDGLSVPFLLFFIGLAGDGASESARLAHFVVEQLGYGVLVGLGLGLVGGWLLGTANRRESIAHAWRSLGVVVLPLLCLLVSEAVGASMFIAAFVCGLAVQIGFREVAEHSVALTEDWGHLLNLSVFFLFGLLVVRALPDFRWTHMLYAILSLTVVRMVPVAVALLGAGLSRATVLFMGWFGPRGLASIVLGLVFLEHQAQGPGATTIRLAVMATVLISIFAHGLTALPGMSLYARAVEREELQGRAQALPICK
jgi:NhaP-type Na+/H+ or K+/H+ antiporter